MSKISIFVAHTCGQENQVIDNPLFVNVRGGAINDTRENVTMVGDNTGDNISKFNKNFSEYSVIYWAWKNCNCDYYGLCHYRRFLSFSDKKFKMDGLQVVMPSLAPAVVHAVGLDDEAKMRQEIEKYDMIVATDHDVVKDECHDIRMKSSKQFWLKYHASYLKESDFDLILELINKHNPNYYDDAVKYMRGTRFRGFNCFVMKKELFNEFCEFAFPILFEFNDRCDRTWNSVLSNRNIGYVGEWLYSIWVDRKIKSKQYKIKETQLIGFADTKAPQKILPAFDRHNVPIVMTTNEAIMQDVAVTVQSVIDNTPEGVNLDFVLLHQSSTFDRWHNQLLDEQLRAIKSMAEDNVSIRDYDPKNDISFIELGRLSGIENEELYYLTLMPWILADYDKAIYLSNTMLAKSDISEILKKDFGNKSIAATRDLYFIAIINGYARNSKENYTRRLGLKDLYNVYSSDIVAFDLKRCRQKYNREKIVTKLLRLDCKSVTEIFNCAYEDDILAISQEWNPIMPFEWDYYELTEYFPQCYDLGNKNYKMSNRRSIHGVAVDFRFNAVKDYLRVAEKTPFYEQALEYIREGKRRNILRMWPDSSNPYIGILRTRDQELADRYFPTGTLRRRVIDELVPQGSDRHKYLKEKLNIKHKKETYLGDYSVLEDSGME